MKKLIYLVVLFLFLTTSLGAVEIKPPQVLQGDSFALQFTSTANIGSSKIFYNKKYYSFYLTTTDNYQIILGTTYTTPTGNQDIFIKIFDRKNKLLKEQTLTLTILEKKFRCSTLVIAPERKEATSKTSLGDENIILGSAFRKKTATNYREGKFLIPCEYLRISSEYGVQRIYTMEEKEIGRWGHKGVDFSNVPGVFIFAANNGKIVVSKDMQVHGKTVVIDHGQGILSTYNHLSQRFVKPGELVKKGDAIGRIGLTGLVTGAHLHFGLSVNNTRVNPMEWFEKEF